MAPLNIGKQATSAYERLAAGLKGIAKKSSEAENSSPSSKETEAPADYVVSGTVDGEDIHASFDSKPEALRFIRTHLRNADTYTVDLLQSDKVIESFTKGQGAKADEGADAPASSVGEMGEGAGVAEALPEEEVDVTTETEPLPSGGGSKRLARSKARIVRKKKV